jgi:hypothetical protein
LTAVKDTAGEQARFEPFIARFKGPAMPPVEQPPVEQTSSEHVPAMQRILDNPFLLLFLGVTLPTVLYLIWGVMEVASIPLAK